MNAMTSTLMLTACLATAASPSMASGSHDFCIDRSAPAHSERFPARFKYGDIDPGREAARVIVSQRYRDVDTSSVTVTDLNPETCPGEETQEISVSASPEQLQKLANAVGQGDVPGAAVLAADIASGASVAIIKNGGGVIEDFLTDVGKIFGL